MQVSIMSGASFGMTWLRWKRVVAEVEQLGFAGLYRPDHIILVNPPDYDFLELIVSLTYLADHSQRLQFGPMVAPFSFRDPVMLARQAMALDDLSGGRMIMAVGAGWEEREHTMFGYTLGDIPTRMARFEEGLEVVTRLMRSEEPVTYEGHFYQLKEALLLPRPQRKGGPPLLLGGNGEKRTLPLVARYADIWNADKVTAERFAYLSGRLDHLLQAAGRPPQSVKRTVLVPVICGRNDAELEQHLAWLRAPGHPLAGESLAGRIAFVRQQLSGLVGTPAEVIEGMRAYAAAGVEEFLIQFFIGDDLEAFHLLAEEVVPHLG